MTEVKNLTWQSTDGQLKIHKLLLPGTDIEIRDLKHDYQGAEFRGWVIFSNGHQVGATYLAFEAALTAGARQAHNELSARLGKLTEHLKAIQASSEEVAAVLKSWSDKSTAATSAASTPKSPTVNKNPEN